MNPEGVSRRHDVPPSWGEDFKESQPGSVAPRKSGYVQEQTHLGSQHLMFLLFWTQTACISTQTHARTSYKVCSDRSQHMHRVMAVLSVCGIGISRRSAPWQWQSVLPWARGLETGVTSRLPWKMKADGVLWGPEVCG
jgi:hypothetical protein